MPVPIACPVTLVPRTTPVWSPLCAPIPPPKPSPFVVGSSSGSPHQTAHRICTWQPNWPVSAIRSAGGVRVLWRTASTACRMPRARGARSAFPPSERVEVLAMATRKPAASYCPATRWSLADLVAALPPHRLSPSVAPASGASSEADLKPPRSVYWLNSHAPDFEAKASNSCQLSLQALRFYQQGRLVICADEKTGMQILQRCSPTSLSNRASPKNVSTSLSAMGCGRYWPPSWCRRASSCGISARPVPVRIGPLIWPTWSTNCLRCTL